MSIYIKNARLVRGVFIGLISVCIVVMPGCGGGGDGDGSSATAPAKLHAILCAANQDESIGADTAIDLNSVSAWIDGICEATGMESNRIWLTGLTGKLTQADLWAAIESLPVNSDDVVIFFYSGHGAANENDGGSSWPVMIFLGDEEVDFREVSHKLIARNARLTISLSDCCNSFWWQAKVFQAAVEAPAENYKKLFMEPRGYIVATAASQGQFSLGDFDGGMFINQFLNCFNNGVQAGSDWQTIIQAASQPLSAYDETGTLNTFNPQYDVQFQ